MQYRLTLLCGITIAAMLGVTAVHAQDTIPKQKVHENKLLEDQLGYAQAVKTGNTLFISGTTATGTLAEQVTTIMDDIQGILQRYGASFRNVVKETVYTTSLDSFMRVQNLRKPYYHGDYPATTWVEVRRLYLPQFLVSIEVTAVLPKEQ